MSCCCFRASQETKISLFILTLCGSLDVRGLLPPPIRTTEWEPSGTGTLRPAFPAEFSFTPSVCIHQNSLCVSLSPNKLLRPPTGLGSSQCGAFKRSKLNQSDAFSIKTHLCLVSVGENGFHAAAAAAAAAVRFCSSQIQVCKGTSSCCTRGRRSV